MFHPGETSELGDWERGFVAGLLLNEGHFGGDGKQPQITLRLHTRHERLMQRLVAWFPRTRLYGPYHHGGRSYYQWMARGDALAEDVLPVLDALTLDFDPPSAERLAAMRRDYARFFARYQR